MRGRTIGWKKETKEEQKGLKVRVRAEKPLKIKSKIGLLIMKIWKRINKGLMLLQKMLIIIRVRVLH